jgi:hypothetical protein
VRQFSADEIVAFAKTFEFGVSFFFKRAPGQTTLAINGGKTIPAFDLDELEEGGDERAATLERERQEEWNR